MANRSTPAVILSTPVVILSTPVVILSTPVVILGSTRGSLSAGMAALEAIFGRVADSDARVRPEHDVRDRKSLMRLSDVNLVPSNSGIFYVTSGTF